MTIANNHRLLGLRIAEPDTPRGKPTQPIPDYTPIQDAARITGYSIGYLSAACRDGLIQCIIRSNLLMSNKKRCYWILTSELPQWNKETRRAQMKFSGRKKQNYNPKSVPGKSQTREHELRTILSEATAALGSRNPSVVNAAIEVAERCIKALR